MKIKLLILSLFFFSGAFAQKILLPVQGNPNTIQRYSDGIYADSVILLSVCNDTPKIDMYKYQVSGKKVTAFTVDTVSGSPKYWWEGWHEISGGGSTNPAGNYGNIQINRNGEFAGSDSLRFETGALFVINKIISQDVTAFSSDATKFISTNSGNMQLQFNASGISGRLNANNISGVKDIALPNVNGNLAEGVTVNGNTYHAGTNGIVDLGTISGGGSFNFDSALATKTTTDLTEGTNLYWTNARGDARYPQLSGSYSNPSWITGLAWSKITGAPSYELLSNKVTTLDSSNTNYPSTSAVKKGLYEKVDKDSISELTANLPIIITSGTDINISADTGRSASQLATGGTLKRVVDSLGAAIASKGNGTVTSFGKTDNWGITSSVTNSTTTPNHAVGIDSATTSGYYLRRKDSSVAYTTPTSLINAVKQPKFTGIEYYKYSGWSNLNDFTDNTMSATVSGGNIVIPDANVSDFTKYLTLDSINCTNHWKMIMLFKRTANPGGGGSGISLGMQSVNTDAICSNAVYFAGAGTLQYFYNSNGGGWSTGIGGTSSALTYSNGDTIRLVIQRDNQHISVVAENLSNGSAAARQIDIDINITSGPIVPNTGRWAIFAQGGTFNVISLTCINNEVKTPNVLVVGDSKTMGFGATNYDSTVTGQLKKWYNGVAVSGGFGDKISDMLLRLPELTAMHAKIVVLNSLGSNDIRFGRSVSATMADYATLRAAFVADGSTIIDISPCYESSQDLTALYNSWKTTYGANSTSIDIFNIPHQYGLSGDGIHDNDATQKAWMKRIVDLNLIEGAKN